jgi:hypothetical protein
MAIERASNEFACPVERVRIIERSDIETGLFDLEACGGRARYTCFVAKHVRRCIREPDPPAWNPDPQDIERLPKASGAQFIRSTPGEARRICRGPVDYDWGTDACVPRPPPRSETRGDPR